MTIPNSSIKSLHIKNMCILINNAPLRGSSTYVASMLEIPWLMSDSDVAISDSHTRMNEIKNISVILDVANSIS